MVYSRDRRREFASVSEASKEFKGKARLEYEAGNLLDWVF